MLPILVRLHNIWMSEERNIYINKRIQQYRNMLMFANHASKGNKHLVDKLQ